MYNKGNIAHNAKYNNPEFVGKKFGRLTVMEIHHEMQGKYHRWMWKCRCDCGKVRDYRGEYVFSGHTASCGCAQKDSKPNLKHGESNTRLFVIWRNMRYRCDPLKVNEPYYDRYGGRGISVCDEWKEYEKFAAWAKSHGYNEKLTIERIDNDGGYCPENCKWVDRRVQARNRNTTMYVEYCGERMSLAEACEIAGMPYKQVFARIRYLKWPVDKALGLQISETRKWKRSERPGKSSFLPNVTAKSS